MTATHETPEHPHASLLFLGTGAADWPTTVPPRGMGHAPHRRLSALLVDGHILIDCGPTVPDALGTFAVPPAALTDLLLTHSHDDHLDAAALQGLVRQRPASPPLRVWGHATALAQVTDTAGLALHPLALGVAADVGQWRIEALAANHFIEGHDEQAVHYLFTSRQHQWLYATDGAWLLPTTWFRLRECRLDAIVWDATIGDVEGDYRIFEHNSLPMLRLMAQTLRREGIIQPEGLVLLTHLARTLHAPHAELARRVKADGFIAAYDGLVVNLASGRATG